MLSVSYKNCGTFYNLSNVYISKRQSPSKLIAYLQSLQSFLSITFCSSGEGGAHCGSGFVQVSITTNVQQTHPV